MFIYIYTHINIYMYMHIHTCLDIYIYTYAYICIFMKYIHVCHDSCICVTWLTYKRDMTHIYVYCVSFICVP